MTSPPPRNVQAAIDFLLSPDLLAAPSRLSDFPDYPALAKHAQRHGHDVTADAIRWAFQLIMRARLRP